MLLLAACACDFELAAQTQPKRVLYLSHSAGFRHDSIVTAGETLQALAPERFEVTTTEDLSYITASRLADFHAVFFFTSGELALDDQQKADLLAFIRNGGGFAAAHSATDTLYTWPEYGELIGGYFDGHPWVGPTDIEIEDPDHPAARAFPSGAFRILDEIYKFRDLSRERVRVLMTLRSSIGGESGINKGEYPADAPLAWCRTYGKGRVFYTALGHFHETWRDERFRAMLLHVLAWVTGEEPGEAQVRPPASAQPKIARVAEPAQSEFAGLVAPGAVVSITGENLTTGSTMRAAPGEPALRLAGTWIALDRYPVRILFASPGRIDVLLPFDLPREGSATLTLASGIDTNQANVPVQFAPALPAIYSLDLQTSQIEITAGGISASAAARLSLDGEELEKIGAFHTEPGKWRFLVKRPSNLATGLHTLTIESEGRSSDFVFYIDVL